MWLVGGIGLGQTDVDEVSACVMDVIYLLLLILVARGRL